MSNLRARRHLLATISTSVLAAGLAAVAAPAMAQDTATAQDSETAGVQEIIVTAQRREENVQDVPIAVTAFTTETLGEQGIKSTQDLAQAVPGLMLGRSGQSGLLFIRGVGNINAATGEEGSNAIYVDGVYVANLPSTVSDFSLARRVEVLKGPQGTLFGRNASGGLINIITKDPGSSFEASGKAGYGNYNTISGQLYVAGPLSDQLGATLTFAGSDQRDAWGRNLTTGMPNRKGWQWGTSGKLVWNPSDDVRIALAADYSRIREDYSVGWRFADGFLGSGGIASAGGNNSLGNDPQSTASETWGVSLTGSVDMGWATATSISALRQTKQHFFLDYDAGPNSWDPLESTCRHASLSIL